MATSFLFLITIILSLTHSLDPTNSPTNAPTNSPTSSPTNAPTYSPTNSPSLSPSQSPTNAPTNAPTNTPTSTPTYSPTNNTTDPTHAPTNTPSFAPTGSPTLSPTQPIPFNTTMQPYTTMHGPPIHPKYQLLVNFSLNFTSTKSQSDVTTRIAVDLAFSSCGIPSNYLHITVSNFIIETNGNYLCNVFTAIDAIDKSTAYQYEDLVNADPDDPDASPIAKALINILPATQFDMSKPKIDIIDYPNGGNGDSADTTNIIIWFLGVSAVCAIGALILIICWKKFSGKDETENEGGINLEFLLDPNAPMDPNENLFTSAMHIENEDENDKTPKKKTKKVKKIVFNRLDDDDLNNNGNDADADADDDDDDNNDNNNNHSESDEYEEVTDDEMDDENIDVLNDDYEPPNFSRI